MTIGPKTLIEAGKMAEQALINYRSEIDRAYHSNDGPLAIGLKLKIAPAKYGTGVDLSMEISFVTDQVKDKINRSIDEHQIGLFENAETKASADRHEILFRKFDWGYPTQEILDAGTPKKEPIKFPKARPFFKRETKRLRALLFKKVL